MKKKIHIFYPNYFANKLIAYVCLQLGEHMRAPDVSVDVMGIASSLEVRPDFYHDAVWSMLSPLAYRFLSDKQLLAIAERRYLNRVAAHDIAYLFPGVSKGLVERLKARGCIVATENINTHQATSRRLMEAEYRRLQLPYSYPVTEEDIEHETAILKHADFAFSPSPLVTRSLVDAGFDEDRVLETSYGLRPEDMIFSEPKPEKSDSDFKVLFVGSICVRKGIPLLLDVWDRADLDGTLVLVGAIADEVKGLMDSFVQRDDVTHFGFLEDLKPVFREADVFVLPSLEEGSPLVTYLAMGAGLPSIVSPMGGGGIIDDGINGIILDPHDTEGWVDALRTLSTNRDRRRELARCAAEKAGTYLWEKVSVRRRELLFDRMRTLNIQ